MTNRMPYAGRERGAVLLTVMVFMAILMVMAATLTNYFLTSEAHDVEASLVEVRTYWAMMGHLNYMASRAGGQGICDDLSGNPLDNTRDIRKTKFCAGNYSSSVDDTSNSDVYTGSAGATFTDRSKAHPAGSLQDYLMEIDNRDKLGGSGARTLADPGTRRWIYPQDSNPAPAGINIANPYHITIRALTRDQRRSFGTIGFNSKYIPLRMDASVVSTDSDPTAPVVQGLSDRADRLTVGFCVTDDGPGTTSGKKHRGCISSDGDSIDAEGQFKISFIMRNAPIPIPSQ